MPRITSLLLLGGLLAAPMATGVAQDRVRPAPRGETPRREAEPDRSRAEPRREAAPDRSRAEPRREEPRRDEPRPRVQERAEPRREAPAERREAPPPRSTGEPELRRRKAPD